MTMNTQPTEGWTAYANGTVLSSLDTDITPPSDAPTFRWHQTAFPRLAEVVTRDLTELPANVRDALFSRTHEDLARTGYRVAAIELDESAASYLPPGYDWLEVASERSDLYSHRL